MTTSDDKPQDQPSPPQPPAAPPADPELHDPYVALRYRDYRRYFTGNAASLLGTQMTTYAVGYELYKREAAIDIHNAALVLGLVGLVQVIPIILLALPAGHLVDRYSRKTLILIGTFVQILLWTAMGFSSHFAITWFGGPAATLSTATAPEAASAAMAAVHPSLFADPHVPILLLLLLVNGMCRSITQPAKQALMPMLVPPKHFANAITWNSSLFEISNVVGPMTGGFALAALLGASPTARLITHGWAFSCIYWANALLQLIQWVNVLRIDLVHTPPAKREPMTMTSMLAGVHFVYNNKVILGAITLDMFAVLLGGATALLPVFAEQVLHVGPIGLAWLRAAPSFGALTTAMVLAHTPPMQKAGRNLLWAVAGFGASIILFGLSRTFWLSIVALIFTGVFDNISVVVRHTLVQLLTPNEMRGRVSAVNSVFISSSNELGEFESGTTAHIASNVLGFGALWGPMLAVAAGGFGTILVVIIVAIAWPQVRAVGRLTQVRHA
jgi:MFS family permease